MKSSRIMVLTGVTITLGCVLAGVWVLVRPAAPEPVAAPAKAVLTTKAERADRSPRSGGLNPAAPAAGALLPQPQTQIPPASVPVPPTQPGPGNHVTPTAPIPISPAAVSAHQDPLAREALSFVGADPVAEAYWIEAINDPHLSAEERQNLIEDLNEDGLSDTKVPSAEDLPLIINRLLLIEDLASEAMDDNNYDAFQEAYKDLLNLAEVAMGGGQPVN